MPRDVWPIRIAIIILSLKMFRRYNANKTAHANVTDRHIAQAFFRLKIDLAANRIKNNAVIPINTNAIGSILD
ncbi:MAG: hypothetical protein Q8P79_02910 [Nanoarchaeota archaeon]|nr:hypothetical protein [Nanoarchaeota archaeon]